MTDADLRLGPRGGEKGGVAIKALTLGLLALLIACGPAASGVQPASTQTPSPSATLTPASPAAQSPLATATPSRPVISPGDLDKGGGLPKVGSDLDRLYQEYQQHFEQQGRAQGFEPSNTLLPVSGNLVVIDAVASGDVNALKQDLEPVTK